MTQDITKAINDSLEKNLPEVVDAVVSNKIKNFENTTGAELEDIKNELKKLTLAQKQVNPVANKVLVQTAMVDIMKGIMKGHVTTQADYKAVVDATMKAVMDEGTAGEGAELVFDQFERDVLRVINNFEVVANVRTYNLVRGDKINFPRSVQGVTTTATGEAVDFGTPTQPTTSFVTIDISKYRTMTSMTEELLDDTMTIPDLYNLIVEFIGESQAEYAENQIINGTVSSTQTIEGILVNADVNEYTLAATNTTVGDITEDDLIAMEALIANKYMKRQGANVRWIMSKYTVSKLMQLRTTDGSRLLPDLNMVTGGSLHGIQVTISDVAPVQNAAADVAGTSPIILGDLRQYILARRQGLTLERGYRTGDWQADIQSLKSITRLGGKVGFGEAFVKLTTASA